MGGSWVRYHGELTIGFGLLALGGMPSFPALLVCAHRTTGIGSSGLFSGQDNLEEELSELEATLGEISTEAALLLPCPSLCLSARTSALVSQGSLHPGRLFLIPSA